MRTKQTHFGGKHRISNNFLFYLFFLIVLVIAPLGSVSRSLKMAINRSAKGTFAVLYLLQLSSQVLAEGTRFASHVSVNTPARSFTHGVGDPLPILGRRYQQPQQTFKSFRRPSMSSQSRAGNGYPRLRPMIPFNHEDLSREISYGGAPRLYNRPNYMDVTIPILPASPYKVDSPDPESLWPKGLFLPPFKPPKFEDSGRRSDSENYSDDPYLLEDSEAEAAVARAKDHGELYFHDIPHIKSLLENQELRVENHLKPHVLGSIRHTWPFYRT